MRLVYYKPLVFLSGALIYGFSMISIGHLFTIETDSTWGIVFSFIGMFVGMGLLCESASYKIKFVKSQKSEEKE